MVTTFSCCGYTYDNQEEPKCHRPYPYVLFEVPKRPEVIENFFHIATVCANHCWQFGVCSNGREWGIHTTAFEKWDEGKDNLTEPIHQYELKLIHITKLTEALKKLPSVSESIEIRDGNAQRRSIYGDEWVIAPKKTAIFTLKTPH